MERVSFVVFRKPDWVDDSGHSSMVTSHSMSCQDPNRISEHCSDEEIDDTFAFLFPSHLSEVIEHGSTRAWCALTEVKTNPLILSDILLEPIQICDFFLARRRGWDGWFEEVFNFSFFLECN